MTVMNRKTFIELTRQYLASKFDATVTAPRHLEVDERTVRFYHVSEVLAKPGKSAEDARETQYVVDHVKQFVAIRLLQISGASLEQIRQKIDNVGTILEQGKVLDISSSDIDSFVESNLKGEPQQTAAAESAPQKGRAAKKAEDKPMSIVKKIRKSGALHEARIKIKVTDANAYANIEENLATGGAFAFLNNLPEETGKRLYRLIHGQKSKGTIVNAVLPIDEDEFELIGCTASGSSLLQDVAILVADKDVYKEGSDVAQLFIFDPSAANEVRKLNVSLDGAKLDDIDIQLDSNGCGVTRVATVASGRYTCSLADSVASCSFEAARYKLAPFTTTLTNIRKDDKLIYVTIEALSFGMPFMGKATVAVVSNNVSFEQHEVLFHEGLATVQFEPKGDSALSLRVTSKEDPDLIASVPLPGTRKEEREETIISGLGKKRTISLIPTQNSFSERGLHIAEGETFNTPVILDNVVSKKVELTFAADIEELHVVVREPVLGTTQIYEIGSVKKGKSHKVAFDSALASVHIGGFVAGKPWEGHAVVVQPSKMTVSVKAPEKLEPGKKLSIKIKTSEKASVLLRIADKRMRVQDSAKTATASMMKRWVTAAIGTLKTGEVAGVNDGQCQCASCVASRQERRRGAGIVRGMGAGAAFGFAGAAPAAAFNAVAGAAADEDVGATAAFRQDFLGVAGDAEMTMKVQQNDGANFMMNVVQPEYTLPGKKRMVALQGLTGPTGATGPSGMSGFKGFSGVSGFSGIAGPAGPRGCTAVATEVKTAVAREMEIDLIYSGLLTVDKEQTVTIQLPDTIGSYDITAFAVSNGDWSEAETSLTVEKETYIEPMLPQYAHPEDGIAAVAIGVRAPKIKKYRITVDGSEEKAGAKLFVQEGENVRCTWNAVPGVHEIVMLDENDNELDKVVRVVECPGEETVLGQELRILKAGEEYNIEDDEGALGVKVLPGIQSELKVAVNVCTDFEHCCCEQTSSGVSAACVAAMVGSDPAQTERAYQAIVKGARRLKAMHQPGKGFSSYPGREIVQNWSSAAARRVANLGVLLESAKLPSETQKAVESMIEMGKDVLSVKNVDHYNEHGAAGSDNDQGDMEAIYYGRKSRAIASADVEKAIHTLNDKNGGYWNYKPKSEAAFGAAVLFKNNQLDLGIKLANAVAKAMGGSLGGAFHGSYESLAYMHMIHEMQKAGVVPGVNSKVVVNGKQTTIEKAMEIKDVETVKASGKGACAVRITRLSKIRFDEMNAGVQISLDVKDKHGSSKAYKSGNQVTLTVKLTNGYQMGDVLCVALPDCLSRIVGGTKAKKFQMDFAGKTELSVDLVAGRKTEKSQRWAAVVRNMYDGARIGSVGLLTAEVK